MVVVHLGHQQVLVVFAVLQDHQDQSHVPTHPVAKPRGAVVEESPRVLIWFRRAAIQIIEASRSRSRSTKCCQVGAQRLYGHAPAQLPAGLAQGRPVQHIGEESVVAGPARQHSLGGAHCALLVTQPILRVQLAEYRNSRTPLKASVENGCVMANLGLGLEAAFGGLRGCRPTPNNGGLFLSRGAMLSVPLLRLLSRQPGKSVPWPGSPLRISCPSAR